MRGTALALLLLLWHYTCSQENVPIKFSTEGVSFSLAPAVKDSDAIRKDTFDYAMQKMDCLSGAPSPAPTVFISVSNRAISSDGVVADIAVTGSCPLGFNLVVPKTTGLVCTFASGWSNGPICDPVTCNNVFADTLVSSNCTSGTSAYGTVCALSCSDSGATGEGPAIATCNNDGNWDSTFSCTAGLIACGNNAGYNLGKAGDTTPRYDGATVDISSDWGSGVKIIQAGGGVNCVAMNDGTIKCMGSNAKKQIAGSSNAEEYSVFSYTGLLGKSIIKMQSTIDSYAILLETGEVYTWGSNGIKQALQSSSSDFSTPTRVNVDGKFATDVTCGPHATVIKLSTGQFYGSGFSTYYTFRNHVSTTSPHYIDASVPSGTTTHFYADSYGAILLTAQGRYYVRAKTGLGHLCTSTSSSVGDLPVEGNSVSGLQGTVVSVQCTQFVCLLVSNTGNIYGCSHNSKKFNGITLGSTPTLVSDKINDIGGPNECPAGTKRDQINTNVNGIAFYGTCPKVLGFSSGLASSVCNSGSVDGLTPIESLPDTYSQVTLGSSHLIALE